MNFFQSTNELIIKQNNIIDDIKKIIENSNEKFKPIYMKQLKMFISMKLILTTILDYSTDKINKENYDKLIKDMTNNYIEILHEYLEVLNNSVQMNVINENQYIELCDDAKKEKGLTDILSLICTMLKP